ncbi:MAG: DeoR family transcriptional regulator, aga operon transcriptional repressor [Actinomycetota bacterium]|nr:DeoR family transcriptional regulator, aga operon transcriptional repressor [Actinomycetota bacterium]
MTLSTARRHSQILEILDQQGSLSVADIARDFAVSPVTARHDLAVLADSGLVSRTRGGARINTGSANEPNFELRRRHRANEKQSIAVSAARLLGDAQIIALDASTTSYYLALELRPASDLFVVTNGLKTAEALSDRPHISVMLTGGLLRRGAMSIVGEVAEDQVRRSRVEIAFFGARAFSPEHGLMDFDPEEARVKRAMASICDRAVGLVDHSKWGRLALLPPVVPTDALDAIVCDRPPEDEMVRNLERRGVKVLIGSDELSSGESTNDVQRARQRARSTRTSR